MSCHFEQHPRSSSTSWERNCLQRRLHKQPDTHDPDGMTPLRMAMHGDDLLVDDLAREGRVAAPYTEGGGTPNPPPPLVRVAWALTLTLPEKTASTRPGRRPTRGY